MGGYGFYVWLSFGLTLLCLLGELVALRARAARLSAASAQ
jgi:heme exporter protein CcmD